VLNVEKAEKEYRYEKPESRKTRGHCYDWDDNGHCRRGDKCSFAHNVSGKEDPPGPDKKRPRYRNACRDFKSGSCHYGTNCKFSHTLPHDSTPTKETTGDRLN